MNKNKSIKLCVRQKCIDGILKSIIVFICIMRCTHTPISRYLKHCFRTICWHLKWNKIKFSTELDKKNSNDGINEISENFSHHTINCCCKFPLNHNLNLITYQKRIEAKTTRIQNSSTKLQECNGNGEDRYYAIDRKET